MAVRAYPDYATAYQNLGDIYAALAAQAYEKSLRLDAKSEAARSRLQTIRALLPKGAVGAAPLAGRSGRRDDHAAQRNPLQSSDSASSSAPPRLPTGPVSAGGGRPPRHIPRSRPSGTVLGTVEDWARAWSSKDVDKYLSYYASDFRTPKGDQRGKWEAAGATAHHAAYHRSRSPRARR